MTERIPAINIPMATQAIVTKSFSGRFRTLRIVGGLLLFTLYFGTAWLSWDGRQAVLWDISERQFHIFAATFWPEDLTLLMAGLVICAFGLFFITVLAGRVWCGYSCPQSMWTWLFLWAEKVTEGDRNQRIRLAQSPLGWNKAARRLQKHTLWLAISVATGVTFVGYFTPIRPLVTDLLTLDSGAVSGFWIAFFTAATYINAGWLREKVCLHMCPYGRFQSVMLDDDSVVISYDAGRGEPRGHRKRDRVPASDPLGDCIDCQQCVQVCPTGIDIRDGLQMACIGCAACIDACDSIMDRMGYDRGLVRYASQNQLAGGRFRPFRPRLIGYAVMLVAMVAALGWVIVSRPLVSLDVAKDRGLFRYDSAGRVENSYQLRLLNKATEARSYRLGVEGPAALSLEGPTEVLLASGESRDLVLAVAIPPEQLQALSTALVFTVVDPLDPDQRAREDSTFTGPGWH